MKVFIYLTFFAMIFLMTVQISGSTIDRKLQNSGIVSLNASETREITPDIAKLTFTIENTNLNTEKASLKNKELTAKISDAIKNEAGVNDEEIKVSALSIYPINSRNKISNYKAESKITINTKNLNNIDKIIEIATKNGANTSRKIVYAIQNEKEACKNIYPDLIRELKKQADDVAKINDQFVIGVKRIDLSCSTNTYTPTKSVLLKDTISKAIKETESVATEAGKIKVTATVDAKYTISR